VISLYSELLPSFIAKHYFSIVEYLGLLKWLSADLAHLQQLAPTPQFDAYIIGKRSYYNED
jgi:hypothetical protein